MQRSTRGSHSAYLPPPERTTSFTDRLPKAAVPVSTSSGHRGLVASRKPVYDGAVFIERAYTERESLSDRDLERLRGALADQVQQYEYAIRNYPSDRMEKHGQPFLSRLLEKVAHVDALITRRKNVD